MKNLTLLLVVILLTSCGPASKLRRAERLIKKAELQGGQWRVDTVFKEVPVFITETRLDSIIVSKPGDTVVIQKDRLKIAYIKLPGDSVWIEGECAADTVYTKVPVRVEKVIYAPQKGLKLWQWILIALAAGLILGILIRR